MDNTPTRRRVAPKMTDEEFERFYAEIYKEFGPKDEVKNTDMLKDVPVRRIPGPYDEPAKKTVAYADRPAPRKKKQNVRGLVAIICLELLGIAGVAAWWVLRLL